MLIAGAVLNLDESAVQSEPNSVRYVVCPRGSTEVKAFSQGKGIHNTVVSFIYADGTMGGMFWIVNGVNSMREWCDVKGNVTNPKLGSKGMIIMSPKGYMTNDGWDIFVDFLIAEITERRVALGLSVTYWFLLAMDGYGSHTMHPIALRKLYLACIICVCFPSHTSSALQALDVALFGPTKRYFGVLLASWAWTEQTGATKWDLLVIMYQAILKAFTRSNIKSGFRATGLFPLNLEWCELNSHKFAISAFLRKTVATDASTSLDWRTTKRAEISLYESMIADYGTRNGRDLVSCVRRLSSFPPWFCSVLTPPCRASSMGLVDSLDCFDMSQLQRIIDETCAVRHKVLMERAVDSCFEIPEMTAERRANRRGKRNAIDELHSEAKVCAGRTFMNTTIFNHNTANKTFMHPHLNQVLNLECRLVLLEENALQKAKAAAEKKDKARAKDLDLAACAWEIMFLKILGYTKDSGKECTIKEITSFADANIPDFKNTIMPGKNGKKNKPEVFLALSKFVRIQQPDKHWIDADGKPAPLIKVPERSVIAPSEPAAPPEAAPEAAPAELAIPPPAAAVPGPFCPVGIIPCFPPASAPAPAPVPLPTPAVAAAAVWLAQMLQVQTQAPGAMQ